MTGEGGAGMTRKEHRHYRVNQCLGTGMTGEGGYLNDILPCGLKSQCSYSYGGMMWKNL